jgi:hypothetical protein
VISALPTVDFDLYMRDKTTLAAINECKKVKRIVYPQHRMQLLILFNSRLRMLYVIMELY